jgi:hypothetical protein
LRSIDSGDWIGFVSPTTAVRENAPSVPPHTTSPAATESKPVEHVAGTQEPPKVTAPVESIVAVWPPPSEKLNAGGVKA